ncbi:MAG: hypothetical protein ACE5LB_08080 [Acidiferrobacterales bacterium]
MSKTLACVAFALLTAIVWKPAIAETESNFWMANDRASINVGVFLPTMSTEVRLSSSTLGLGTRFSLENDLGMDDEPTVPRIEGYYRFTRRHRIDYSLQDLSRDATTVLQRDIQYGDVIFPAGTQVASNFDLKVLKVSYMYSFFQTRTWDLGFTAGLYGFDFDGSIVAPAARLVERDEEFAPFPMVGIRATYALKPVLFLKGSFEYFEIDRSDVEAEVTDIWVALEYKTGKKLGIGIGYNDFDLDGEDKEDRDEVSLKYDGFMLYAKIAF